MLKVNFDSDAETGLGLVWEDACPAPAQTTDARAADLFFAILDKYRSPNPAAPVWGRSAQSTQSSPESR